MQKINYLDFPEEYKLRGEKYMKAIDKVFRSGVYVLGPEVVAFEKEFAKFLGVKNCIGVANGLEAIQIALMALGVGKGDEVITTPVSAVATTLAIIAVGATPVFVDIKENGQIDECLVEKAITKNTKAILPVHLYGQPADIVKIKKVCNKHKLFLVEDACQAHGSTLKTKKLGTYGEVGCFSFYPTKNLGAFGDGGALVTNNEKLATVFRQLRDYGQESKYKHAVFGLNSRLDELHAALLRVKLGYLDRDNLVRRKVAARYIKNLRYAHGLTVVLPEKYGVSNFHIFAVRTNKRDGLREYLAKNGIPSLIHYPITIPDQPLFHAKYKDLKIPVARSFTNETLSLPCHPFIDLKDVDYICEHIKKYFDQDKR